MTQSYKNLFHLQDDDVGVAALENTVADLSSSDAEALLFGYANAGRSRLVKVLLINGSCSVDAQRAKDGCTALHLAYFRNRTDVIDVLKVYGADASIRNKYGETAAEAAKAAH